MKRIVLLANILTLSSTGHAATSEDLRFSDYPILTREALEALDLEDLKTKTQAELDLLYGQLTSGSLPDGPYDGHVVFDDRDENDVERVLAATVPPSLENWIKHLGTSLWRGKTFDREEGTLTNRMGSFQRFPARVYCGQSLLDARRESIVLDYAYGDTISSYVHALDWPMARWGLSIRDEIRMVKPGLYLGRAYIRGIYTLNFILSQAYGPVEQDWTDSCRT